jgi:hypothetical protein
MNHFVSSIPTTFKSSAKNANNKRGTNQALTTSRACTNSKFSSTSSSSLKVPNRTMIDRIGSSVSDEHTDKKRKISQSFLDFGQKSVKQQSTCSLCGMLFAKGVHEDELAHKRFCQSQGDLKMPSAFRDTAAVVCSVRSHASTVVGCDEILQLSVAEMTATTQFDSLFDQIMRDLGSNREFITEVKGLTCYLYVVGGKSIGGCAFIEMVSIGLLSFFRCQSSMHTYSLSMYR